MDKPLHANTLFGDAFEKMLSKSITGGTTWKAPCMRTRAGLDHSVRRTTYMDLKECVSHTTKSVHMLKGKRSVGLLIQGDGRKLDELESDSVSAIITDHPWDSKSNRGGNRYYTTYDTFRYTQEDFNAKARVLIDGGYPAEFLPIKSAENRKYLNQIDERAEKSGLRFYCNIIWRKQEDGTVNTGRCTKGVEQIAIYTKGSHDV